MLLYKVVSVCSSIICVQSSDMPLTLYGEKVLSAYPCVSFRLIENTGTKKGRYMSMARRSTPRKRTFSAARLSDILRGSYRLAPQSPASSQCRQDSPAQARPVYPTGRRMSIESSLFFIKISRFFLCILQKHPCPLLRARYSPQRVCLLRPPVVYSQVLHINKEEPVT